MMWVVLSNGDDLGNDDNGLVTGPFDTEDAANTWVKKQVEEEMAEAEDDGDEDDYAEKYQVVEMTKPE